MNHDGHDGHDGKRWAMRLRSPLSYREEEVMSGVIDCAMHVHKTLGPGFLESIYKKAMCVAMSKARLQYEREKSIEVCFEGIPIHGQRMDLFVEDLIVVELKSVTRFEEIHTAQVLSYLKAIGRRGGLLINFRVPLLHRGIRRIVL
jgi:GxxExxY protein